MVEFNGAAVLHRQSVTTLVGTQNGTILGPAPPQMMYEITEVVAAGFGTVGGPVVNGRLMSFATLQGYSQYGTLLGTIVEPFSVAPGSAFIDGPSEFPVAYVYPGGNLYGVVDSGSVQVKVVWRPINARGL